MQLALTKKQEISVALLKSLESKIGKTLVNQILENKEDTEALREQKLNDISELNEVLNTIDTYEAKKLRNLSEYLRKLFGYLVEMVGPMILVMVV